MEWKHAVSALHRCLSSLTAVNGAGMNVPPDMAFSLWCEMTEKVRRDRHVVYFVGNGASASMASHMSADLAKNAAMHTQVLTDIALITAMGNDMGYDSVYSEPLRVRGKSRDMLVAISSSGMSRNILNVVDVANEIGMDTVTLSAMSENNSLRLMGSLNFHVAAGTYGYAESCHAVALHHWLDMVCMRMGRAPVDALAVPRP